MNRPITLFTGQWADMPFATLLEKASGWGFDGLELACWGDHLDVRRAVSDPAYARERRQFGLPLADFELVQEKIGWMVAFTFGLEAMAYMTTGLVDAGVPDCPTLGVHVNRPWVAVEVKTPPKLT